jgi:hypothetical protein
MKIENVFVPYKQALALKELGFDEPCIKYYWTDGMFTKTYESPFNHNKRDNSISAPLYQQAFSFFREKYNIHGIILYYGKNQWNIELLDYKGNQLVQIEDNTFWSYKEAELECLKKLVEIVKE